MSTCVVIAANHATATKLGCDT